MQKMSKSRQFSMMHTSLKRNRESYESTALQTMQQTRTIPKHYYKKDSFNAVKQPTIKPAFLMPKQYQEVQQSKKQVRPMVQKIATNISSEKSKCKREVNSKSMRHFYYRGISRTINHPMIRTPKIVFELSERANIRRKKASSPLVSYTHGFLQQANCVYYAIQNKIVFIRTQDLFNYQVASDGVQVPFVIYEVRDQVINVFQILGSNIMFPNHDLIIGVVHPWEIQFYAWEPGNVNKKYYIGEQVYQNVSQTKQIGLKSLNFVYGLPIQRLEHIDYGADGKLFFFDEEGALHQITPYEERLLLLYKTGKYSIRNYVNNSLNTFQILSTKHGKFAPLFNLASSLAQASKYLFPSKITTRKIFCDRKKNLLFGLLQKKIQLPFSHQNQTFIVCYDVKQKAKLIHKFSQNYFIQKYGSHIHSQRINQFRIQSIYPAPDFYQCANISIISKSGIKIIMQILPNDAKIVEIIRPPDQRMFQTQISITTNQYHYPPKQKSPYQVHSYLEDQEKTIYTVTREKGILNTFITASSVLSGTIDISQQANNVNLQIFREGNWKLKIYKINERKMLTYLNQNVNEKSEYFISQLSSQTLLPPAFYLFQGPLKMQLMSYIRPIDLLFTALSVMNMQSHTFRLLIQKNINKQKLLMKIFLSQSFNFSLIGNFEISIQELCSMLLQILIDKDGLYFYSSEAAGEIVKIWQSFKKNHEKIKINTSKIHNFNDFNEIQNYDRFNNIMRRHSSHFRVGTNQICSYKKISQKLLTQTKQILQQITLYGPDLLKQFQDRSLKTNNNQIFYDFSEVPFKQQQASPAQKITKQKLIQFKINSLVNYLSRMLLHIWELKVVEIMPSSRLFLLSKLQYFYSYLRKSQSQLKIYSAINIPQSHYINKQYDQLLFTVSRIMQLLFLLDNIPILPQQKEFGFCLSDRQNLFEESMFKAIHREFRAYIINKWKSMFPAFVSDQFVKLIRLYGEIEEMTNKENVMKQLKNQSIVLNYPSYFLHYLSNIRKFTDQQIEQILKASQKTKKINNKQISQANDFEFQMPNKLIQIVNSYNKSSEKLSQSDLQYIKNLLITKNEQNKLTITNKQSIITYIKANLPKNKQIQHLAKYISVQYQLYRYYLKQVQKIDKESNNSKWRIFNLLCNKKNKEKEKYMQQNNAKYNALTMQLLRFQTIIDCDDKDDKLKKLVITTADYWLMLDYYTTFQDYHNLQNILKDICIDFSSNANKKYSSFSAYIERYLLNIALKSQHSNKFLPIICTKIDEYLLQHDPVTKNAIMNWMSFNNTLSYISDSVIWLPQLLIKIGYDPKDVFNVYINQMQDSFEVLIPFQTQIRFGFKILNCFMLTDKYVKSQRKEFAKVLILQLDAYEKNQKTKNKSIIGVRKMLDQLISKSI